MKWTDWYKALTCGKFKHVGACGCDLMIELISELQPLNEDEIRRLFDELCFEQSCESEV